MVGMYKAAWKYHPQAQARSGAIATDNNIAPLIGTWRANAIRLFLKYRSDELEHTILHRILKGNMGRRSWGRGVQLLIKEVGSTEKPAILNHYIEKWRSSMETEELQRRLLASPCIQPTWPASTWHNVLAQVPAPPTIIERSYLRLRLGCYMTAERMSEKGLIKTRALPTV